MSTARVTFDSPLGPLTLHARDGEITALDWGEGTDQGADPALDLAREELTAYFAGERLAFSVPLAPGGSDFSCRFLSRLGDIPYGETVRYGELADELGVTAQAIGQACGANPIPVLIPCHRVLGAQGLGGYSGSGGVETKVALLKLEGAASLLL